MGSIVRYRSVVDIGRHAPASAQGKRRAIVIKVARMRSRPSARLLILDPSGRVLLFRFVHKTGALAGRDFWATPGGGVEDGETFEQTAHRELLEETGIRVQTIGPEIVRLLFTLQMPDGEHVEADDRFFLVKSPDASL